MSDMSSINIPSGSLVFVKNYFAGDNVPDGGPFRQITGTIVVGNKSREGIILNTLFDEDQNGVMIPKSNTIISTDHEFNFNSTVDS